MSDDHLGCKEMSRRRLQPLNTLRLLDEAEALVQDGLKGGTNL
jgi:hypothetical protein